MSDEPNCPSVEMWNEPIYFEPELLKFSRRALFEPKYEAQIRSSFYIIFPPLEPQTTLLMVLQNLSSKFVKF